jgi:hypothetical protein
VPTPWVVIEVGLRSGGAGADDPVNGLILMSAVVLLEGSGGDGNNERGGSVSFDGRCLSLGRCMRPITHLILRDLL